MEFLRKNKMIILLLMILLLGGFFRFYNLKSVPAGLYPDEAINGMDAISSLRTGQFKVFYPENNGREGLFIWLIALSFKIFGVHIWSLRLVSAIIGFLTILGLFLLAKELFNRKIALLASFFLAVSFWHTNFSRIGFRAIFVPFLMCFSFYFLFKGLSLRGRSPKQSRGNSLKLLYFILAGIFFGLGFYTYIAFRVAVLLLAIVVLMEMWNYWQKNKPLEWSIKKIYIKDGWWRWDVFFVSIIIIVLPLVFHFYKAPQDFFGRSSEVSIFSSQEPLQEFAISAVKTLGMFNFSGDWNWRHNLSGAPMLAWVVGILFLLGLVLIIINFIFWIREVLLSGIEARAGMVRAKRESERFSAAKILAGDFCVAKKHFSNHTTINACLFILFWFLIMLLPAVLTSEGIPHALRTIGVIPVVYIFAAIGLVWLFEIISRKINKKLAVVFVAAVLIHPLAANFNQYFCRWGKNPETAGAFRQDLVDIGNYLNGLDAVKKFVVINEWGVPVPYPDGPAMPSQTIMFMEQMQKDKYPFEIQELIKKTEYIRPEQINQISIDYPTVIILSQYDENFYEQLSQKWPNGKMKLQNNVLSFWVE